MSAVAICAAAPPSYGTGTTGVADVKVVANDIGFPEGTVFAKDTLYFVDYQASTVNRLTASGYSVVAQLPGCGANGLVVTGTRLLVACYDSGGVQEIALDGTRLRQFDRGSSGERFSRPNDLSADAQGGVYFTASGDESRPGKVYYLPPHGTTPREVAGDIRNANGIALSPDGHTLYVGESTTDTVLRYAIGPDGTLTNRSIFAALDTLAPKTESFRHTPDGIRVDREGRMLIALYNGGGVWVLNDRGALQQSIALPGEHHSNLAISGDQQTLYVTSLSSTSGGQILRLPNPVFRR